MLNRTHPPVDAVIFDRDGVLADFRMDAASAFFAGLLPLSLAEISNYWEAWGQKVGFPRTIAEEKDFFQGFWQMLCDELALDDLTRRSLMAVDYTDYMVAYPDARPALVLARQQNRQVGVLSNFALASLDHSLEAIGLRDLIHVTCAATVIGVPKPEPEAYLMTAKSLGVKPENCLFFDDEELCVEGARAVGMQAYHVNRWRNDHDIQHGVVCNLDGLKELLNRAPFQ